MRCDVLVVGAGPAGASAAQAAAREGVDVLVVERRRAVGVPVQCAEFVPTLLAQETPLSGAAVARKVDRMKVIDPGGDIYEAAAPGFILNRAVFDKDLVAAAAQSGARVMLRAEFAGREGDAVILRTAGRTLTASAKVIIGADGPRSAVGRSVGATNRDFAVALQYELPLAAPMDWTEVHFHKVFRGGYGWVFPKATTANVGVGMTVNRSRGVLKYALRAFVQKLFAEGKVLPDAVAVTGGLIPVGGPLRTVRDNVLLVGDAAGQTHAVTGGGIPQAVVCGKLAGAAAAAAVRRGRLELLRDYDAAWQELCGDELRRAVARRREMEGGWDNLTENFKRWWVTFPEYYE